MVKNDNIVIDVSGVTKTYKKFTAVDDISFKVCKGDIFAFLGPNGAGKSTTVKMLTTLTRPDLGYIRVNGHDTQKHKDKVRKSFGIVFQDQTLDTELTVYENMQFHAALYNIKGKKVHKSILNLLEYVDLADRKDSYVKTLSGGMKRRLEIARSMMHRPGILFLDEPTLGLDTQTRHFLWEYLKDINMKEKITIFLTTHYLDEAEEIANKIAIIDKGRIIAFGTSTQIKKKTKSKTLEEAYLKLLGKNMSKNEKSGKDMMRSVNRNVGGG